MYEKLIDIYNQLIQLGQELIEYQSICEKEAEIYKQISKTLTID